MQKISLNGRWLLSGKPQNEESAERISLSAAVPGCVQLDLAKGGYLPKDLYMGENILAAEKYEEYEWWYQRRFEAPTERENLWLVFEGVDCLAEYFLNGQRIGESANMLIAHEFRIDEYIKEGENLLTVHLSSPTLAAEEQDYTIKMLSHYKNPDARHLRKAPHSYGWDIMPRMVTVGLWREVRLEVRDPIYFTQTFFDATGEDCRFYYTLSAPSGALKEIETELSAECGDSRIRERFPCRKRWGFHPFHIENPKKWWPYGYGKPHLYEGTVRIFAEGRLIHEEPITFGVRKVELDRRDPSGDDPGQFRILINDTEVLCKGSNWVPLDAFHSKDAQRYEKALALVKEIGCNILRCWGGNVYEDHAFFDFCDQNGIMVWQDFAMACSHYPEIPAFKAALEQEATAVIRKLRNHPSLVLWAGDNEVDSSNPRYDPDQNPLTREVLPKCVELNDYGRPYLPSSPYITHEMFAKGERAQVLGSRLVEDHLWGPRDYFKSPFYTTNQARFVSETGYHGCPAWESIQKFITPEKLWPYTDNAEWILHSSDQQGNDKRVMLMENQVRRLFGEVPTAPEDYVLASQISQAEAKKYFIERIRVGRPNKTGIIWWNLLDGWPQMSDAVVDYYFTKKLAFFYIKRSQAPFTVCANEPKEGRLTLFACNDTLEEKSGLLSVKDALTDENLYEGRFSAPLNTATPILALPAPKETRFFLFEWKIGKERGANHYLCGEPPVSLAQYRAFSKKLEQILLNQ